MRRATVASIRMHTVILFYTFVDIAQPETVRDEQRALCERLSLKGRILIAAEGINGTLEGGPESILEYQKAMRENPLFAKMPFKESAGNGDAFRRLEVKVRDEVVTLGAGRFDVARETAAEMSAEELHELYASDEDFVVLDLRNDYEIEAGYFERTEHPGLRNFRELPEKIEALAHLKKKKVVAVCTGGIRCEKATCLLKKEGFEEIYQLKDGIHTYMQKYPAGHFKGTLFVFDNRMTTDVVEVPGRAIVGKCTFCGTASEDFYSDDSQKPSLKLICCATCLPQHAELRTA
jgi:UPF0176 protein